MTTIQLNEKGTHHLEVEDRHFLIIKEYSLFRDLVDSTGYVTEQTLDKLKFHVKSLIGSVEDPKSLIDLSYEVIYHPKMKALGLKHLIEAYALWNVRQENPVVE